MVRQRRQPPLPLPPCRPGRVGSPHPVLPIAQVQGGRFRRLGARLRRRSLQLARTATATSTSPLPRQDGVCPDYSYTYAGRPMPTAGLIMDYLERHVLGGGQVRPLATTLPLPRHTSLTQHTHSHGTPVEHYLATTSPHTIHHTRLASPHTHHHWPPFRQVVADWLPVPAGASWETVRALHRVRTDDSDDNGDPREGAEGPGVRERPGGVTGLGMGEGAEARQTGQGDGSGAGTGMETASSAGAGGGAGARAGGGAERPAGGARTGAGGEGEVWCKQDAAVEALALAHTHPSDPLPEPNPASFANPSNPAGPAGPAGPVSDPSFDPHSEPSGEAATMARAGRFRAALALMRGRMAVRRPEGPKVRLDWVV